MPQNTNVSNLHFPITSPFRACPDFSSGGSKEGVDSDHLGSSSFITDTNGNATQHLQYLPFGELFIEQRSDAAYNTPYKFSAKEKDEETGYSYFGARYYLPEWSIWGSVDPMADKYPNISSYAYCAWNPIVIIDPDGKEVEITGEASDKAKDQLQKKTNLILTRNPETGRLSYEGKAKNKIDKKMAEMIDNPNIRVKITAKNSNKVSETASINEYGGGYMGNEVQKDENGKKTSATANQFVNPDVIESWDIKTESGIGVGMLHEVAEAYAGGEIALKTGKGSPDSRDIKNTTYEQAHRIANKIAPGNIQPIVYISSKPISFNVSKGLFGNLQFQPVFQRIKYQKVGN